MGLFDKITGSLGAGGGSSLEGMVQSMAGQGQMGVAISTLLQRSGGVSGLLQHFQQAGLGGVVQSWVGSDQNQPVSPDQVQNALGDDHLQAAAQNSGMNKDDLLSKLSQALPGIIDKLTPGGQAPGGHAPGGGQDTNTPG